MPLTAERGDAASARRDCILRCPVREFKESWHCSYLSDRSKFHTPEKAEKPPSMGMTAPWTKLAESESSHSTAPTRSSGVPNLP